MRVEIVTNTMVLDNIRILDFSWVGCERVARLLDSFLSYKPLADNSAFIQKYSIKEFA